MSSRAKTQEPTCSESDIPGYEPPPPDPVEIAAGMLREALQLIATVALSDAENGQIVLSRMAGKSLSEIGISLHISKQAVHKRVLSIADRWPHLAAAICDKTPAAYDVADHVAILAKQHRLEKKRQEATRWMSRPN